MLSACVRKNKAAGVYSRQLYLFPVALFISAGYATKEVSFFEGLF